MWKQVVNRTVISIDDERRKFKIISVQTAPPAAPLVSFDQHGDILYADADRAPSMSASRKTLSFRPDCHTCTWKRFRTELYRCSSHFLSSQLGLFILVSIYIVLGGLMFCAIESRYESRRNEQTKIRHSRGIENIRQIVNDEFNWMLNASFELRYALWRGMWSRHDGIDNTGWRVQVNAERFDQLIDQELARRQAEEEKLSDKHDSRSDRSYNQKWTYFTAMLFSATVITTVGYGNIVPKSVLGKLVTCLYAMIGIPIMIMCLTNTGDLLAVVFIKYYSIVINFLHRKIRQRRKGVLLEIKQEPIKHVPIAATFGILSLYIVAGAILFSRWEGWSFVDGAYFSFITFTTIGLGDFVPGKGTLTDHKSGKSLFCALYLLFGLVLTAMAFKLMQDDLSSVKKRLFARLGLEQREHQHRYSNRHSMKR